jgi:hypothetical protein
MNPLEPLPTAWCDAVMRILSKGTSPNVRWSFRAQQDWQQFGLPFQAHALLVKTLRQPGIRGERVSTMIPLPNPPKDAGTQVVYGFLCQHPLGGPKPLYAKVGLFANKVTLDLFSLHIDLSGALAKRIAQTQKKRL